MKKKGVIKGVCICAAICIIGIAAYMGYINKLNSYTNASVYISLAETATQQKFNINQEIVPDIRILEDVASYLGNNTDTEAVHNSLLTDLADKTHFKTLSFFNTGGLCVLSAGSPIDSPASVPTLAEVKSRAVSFHMVSEGMDAFLMSIPVADENGQCLGTLVGVHEIAPLRKVLLPFYHNEGITYVISKNCHFDFSSNEQDLSPADSQETMSFWKKIENTDYVGYDTAAQMEDNASKGTSGNMIYRIDGQKRFAHYETVGTSDWFVFTVVDEHAVASQRDLVLHSAFILTSIMVATISILIFYIFRQQLKHNSKLEHAAYFDELCGCPNLNKFKMTAQQFILQHRQDNLAMIKLDIDRFKLVNQTLGTDTGDTILIKLSDTLKENVGNNDFIFGRAHDDQFYILQHYQEQLDLSNLRNNFYNSFLSRMGEDFHYHIKFVSGVCYIPPESGINAIDAIEKANIAHQKAKATGKELCIYDETFIKDALRKKDIEERMESALKNQEFQVYFQPQYSLHKNAVFGAEALVRWHISENVNIYPDEFIPLFEENNFIIQLDMYMFERVCQIMHNWIESGLTPISVSVNFARNHLVNINFVDELCTIADRHNIPHQLLEVELTERVIAQGEELSLQILESLHHNGFSLAMDDFGTGYSSLGLLKSTPIDVIKIDKSFIDNADSHPRTKAVLCNVLRLAKDLRAYTIAEGVETEATSNLLRDLGCDAIQGYYYGRPVPEYEFRKSLEREE